MGDETRKEEKQEREVFTPALSKPLQKEIPPEEVTGFVWNEKRDRMRLEEMRMNLAALEREKLRTKATWIFLAILGFIGVIWLLEFVWGTIGDNVDINPLTTEIVRLLIPLLTLTAGYLFGTRSN